MFRIDTYTADTFSTSMVRLPGGDFFSLIETSAALTLVFRDNNFSELGRISSLDIPVKLDWRSGKVALKEYAPGDVPRAFRWVDVTAAASCIPKILISEGIDAESLTLAGSVTVQTVSNHTETTRYSKTDTQTQAIAARSGRKQLFIQSSPKNGAGTYVWTGGAINKGLCLPAGASVTYADFDGAITLYSEGANDICVEETY